MGLGSKLFLISSFEVSWWNSSAFESPMTYLFELILKNTIVALLRFVIIAQTYPIYVVLLYCYEVSIEHHFSFQLMISGCLWSKSKLAFVIWLCEAKQNGGFFFLRWFLPIVFNVLNWRLWPPVLHCNLCSHFHECCVIYKKWQWLWLFGIQKLKK